MSRSDEAVVAVTLKIIVGVAALVGILIFVVVNFSEISSEFVCEGELLQDAERKQDTAFVVLNEYRWWVHLWGQSDGNIRVQLEKTILDHYVSRIEKIGDDFLAIYKFWNDDKTKVVGGLQSASSKLTIIFHDGSVFVGKCKIR